MSFKEYLTKSAAQDESDAVDKALGLPRKGVSFGRGPHAQIPDAYAMGAVGWTATECELIEDVATGTALLSLTDAAVAVGKVDVVVNGKTIKLDMTKDVLAVKPGKFRLPSEPPVSNAPPNAAPVVAGTGNQS